MHVFVNKNRVEIKSPNLYALLNQLGRTEEGIAVAVNDNIVTKSLWKSYVLENEDQVLLIVATAGG